MKLSDTQKIVAASAAALQAGVTVAAAITGGLPTLFLNEKTKASFALGALILAGLLVAAVASLGDLEPKAPAAHLDAATEHPARRAGAGDALRRVAKQRGPLWTWRVGLTMAASLLFAFALYVTAYAAVRVPGAESEPEVSASLQDGNPLVLKATVKTSGVAKGENLNIYVDGLREIPGKYEVMSPTLYQAHIGASASGGDVNDSFTVLIPVGKYNDVGVSAWKGSDARCSPPLKPSTHKFHKGCVVIRLVNLGAGPKAASKTATAGK